MATSIRSPDSSCNASTTGSSNSRTHMLGNVAKSSASVASDTKDNNGESLCAVSMKYCIMLNQLCTIYITRLYPNPNINF